MHCRLWLIILNFAKIPSKTRLATHVNGASTVEQPVRERVPRMSSPNVNGEGENVGVNQIFGKMTKIL
jgi:hypothetical protein